MNKLDVLNSVDIVDYSCTGEECEYVLVESTVENHEHLLEAGFTEQEIKEASDGMDSEIDIAHLAFNYAGAKWWSVNDGFGLSTEKGADK